MKTLFKVLIAIILFSALFALIFISYKDPDGKKFCERKGHDEVKSAVFSSSENKIVCSGKLETFDGGEIKLIDEFEVEETFFGWREQ